jgi:hypothetical protein
VTTVLVAEQRRDPDGSFRARVSFGDGGGIDVTIADPAPPGAEKAGRLGSCPRRPNFRS